MLVLVLVPIRENNSLKKASASTLPVKYTFNKASYSLWSNVRCRCIHFSPSFFKLLSFHLLCHIIVTSKAFQNRAGKKHRAKNFDQYFQKLLTQRCNLLLELEKRQQDRDRKEILFGTMCDV